jgi:hypothetical protein
VRSCWRVQLPPPLQVGDPLFVSAKVASCRTQAISSSGDNNSCAGKFVERRVDSDHNRLVPDQQTPRCLMLPNVPAIWALCKALQHKRQLRK